MASGGGIRGNWATLLLPVRPDDAIDYDLLAAEIDHFVAVKVDGVYSNGSAGEFHTQTEEEFDTVSALLAEKCGRGGLPFQIGACHMSAQISRARVRRAKALRPAAFQIVLPDWFVPTWDEIRAFLSVMVEEAAPVPLVLYNPPHAKRRLTPDEWRKIAEEFPAVVGCKVPGGDDDWYAAMRPVLARMAVFIPGHQLASGIARGAHGAYSNVACLNPAAAQLWADLCRQDLATALEQEKRLQRFWLGNVAPLITRDGYSNMAADKAAAAAGGWLPGLTSRLRWPYRGVDSTAVAALAEAAQRELPEFAGHVV